MIYNHVGTLSKLGYVRKEDWKYCPSLRLLSPGERTYLNHDTYRVARSYVDNPAEMTNEVVTFFIEEDGLGIYTYMAAGTNFWSPDYVYGDALPVYVTAP